MDAVVEKYIELNGGIRGGRPHIAGTRITVDDVVLMHTRMGESLEQIASVYKLSVASLYAAMAYYFDHKSEIDQKIDSDDAYIEAVRQRSPSKLQAKLRALRGE